MLATNLFTTVRAEFPKKLQFLFEPHRFKVAKGGRGGAKSWNFARALLLQGAERPLRILCARETQKSIKDSVHQLLEDQIQRLGLKDKYDVQMATILGKNGTEIIFAGLKHNIDNIKSVEGCDIVWVEEAQTVSRESWDKLLPTIRKEGSEIWISYNPELDTDETHKRFALKPPPGACVVTINYTDNPWFPDVLKPEVEHLKATDPKAYEHIWMGATRSAIEGGIFSNEMEAALKEKRLTTVPYDRTKPVDTFWDLGYGDTMAIWFAQCVGGYYNVIDYLEDAGKPIHHYVIQLQQRGYVYGVDWLPHDGVDAMLHHNLTGDKTKSPEMLMRAAGRKVRIAPKMLVTSRINAARTVFPQCRFDEEKCADGILGLRHYQWGEPASSGQERTKPLHDWASHPSDAFCTLALGIKNPPREEQVRRIPPSPQTAHAWMG